MRGNSFCEVGVCLIYAPFYILKGVNNAEMQVFRVSVCVCACVCVGEREPEGQKEAERDKETERDRERERQRTREIERERERERERASEREREREKGCRKHILRYGNKQKRLKNMQRRVIKVK